MTATLELDGVSRAYGGGRARVEALRGVSLAAAAGELVCVMGPSGCGKSTLLALAGGLERPDSGSVLIDGQLLGYTARERALRLQRQVGFVFQELNLLRDLTAIENVALSLELAGVSRRKAHDGAAEALDRVGLADLAGAFPADLAGGEQQRVAIARGLIGERRLLLADEPTGALDSLTGELVMRLIRARCESGVTAVIATHDAGVAAFADRVIFLRDGAVAGESRGALPDPAAVELT
jgi:putative ABC transport system ATP-binding protein